MTLEELQNRIAELENKLAFSQDQSNQIKILLLEYKGQVQFLQNTVEKLATALSK